MPVSGWTSAGKDWTGSESSAIAVVAAGGTGFLTRDANDGIGDFDFICNINTTLDSDFCGGMVFGYQNTSQFYYLTWRIGYTSVFYLQKDSLVHGSGAISSYFPPAGESDNTFSIKIERRGSTVRVYRDVNQGTSWTLIMTYNSATSYTTGKIGFGYPDNFTSLTNFFFQSITVPGTGGIKLPAPPEVLIPCHSF